MDGTGDGRGALTAAGLSCRSCGHRAAAELQIKTIGMLCDKGASTGRASLVITRDVEASAVADLALSPPRAALATTVDDEILVLPVSVTVDEPVDPASSPRIVQVPEGDPDLAGRNVVVIADDGPQWFRLRSLTVRGIAKAMGDCTYRVVPKRIVAWDYGSLREVETDTARNLNSTTSAVFVYRGEGRRSSVPLAES